MPSVENGVSRGGVFWGVVVRTLNQIYSSDAILYVLDSFGHWDNPPKEVCINVARWMDIPHQLTRYGKTVRDLMLAGF